MQSSQDAPVSVDLSVHSDPCHGVVRWNASKSLWWLAMTLIWIYFFVSTLSVSSVFIFLILSAITLCFGHSLGMHRKLIHGAFECPKWLERLCIYCSTLVGLGGPFSMMQTHDTRDWAQRLPACHPFLSHQNNLFKDFYWQLHCKLHLKFPPELCYPKSVQHDRFYQLLQTTSMLQQLPLALVLYWAGGWAWVVWGVCARVSVSVFGHWLIGYFAHNSGHRSWHLNGCSVQGHNVKGFGLISFGECWHNNHHAFPGSAKMGLHRDQFDPGWQVLKVLKRFNLVWNIKTPENLPKRENLVRLALADDLGWRKNDNSISLFRQNSGANAKSANVNGSGL